MIRWLGYYLLKRRCRSVDETEDSVLETLIFEALPRVGFPDGTSGREPTSQCQRHKRCKFNPWIERSPGGRHGNLLQYSCMENPMDRGAWRVTVHGVAKSQTPLMQIITHTHRMQRKGDQQMSGYLSLKFKRKVMAEDIIWDSSVYPSN